MGAGCSVQSELELLCIKPYNKDYVKCIDLSTKRVIFETVAYPDWGQVHHWLMIQGVAHLAVQSAKNVVKFFSVDSKTKQFTENQKLKVTLKSSDKMRCVTFDKNGENIFFVKNDVHFEQQAVSSDHGVVMRMRLQEAVAGGQLERNVSVSDDGTFSALGGGDDNPYWYLIDVGGQKVTKLTSKRLENSWAPC